MPGLDFIKNIFVGGAGELAGKIKDIVDESKYSAEEKADMEAKMVSMTNEHYANMADIAQRELESHLKDVQDAREANTRIQETANASWLAKNIAYCLDIALVASFIIMLLIIVFKVVPEANKELFYTAFGLLGANFATVINFHRGTSAGSKSSGDAIRNILKTKV